MSKLVMLYLADELYKQRGKTITFRVGDPIYVSEFDRRRNDYEIAQEIIKYMPEAVTKHADGYYMVNYGAL